jgi:hypothetical protein
MQTITSSRVKRQAESNAFHLSESGGLLNRYMADTCIEGLNPSSEEQQWIVELTKR